MALTKIIGEGIQGISNSANATAITISSDEEVTMPLQPAFCVHKNGTSQSNLAADASSIVITFGTEIYDIGSNFASNTFTAPVTGKYLLSLKVALRQVDKDANYIYIKMNTSNRSYSNLIDADFGTSDMQYWNVDQSFLVDMDANDTVDCRYQQSGGGAQVDIDGTQEYTSFSGVLVC